MPFEATPQAEAKAPALPYFKPRRNARRLDYRPVAWSLRNRPNEWHIDRLNFIYLHHLPTDHRFRVHGPLLRTYLCEASGCGCMHGSGAVRRNTASFVDNIRVWLAYRALQRASTADRFVAINRQFTAHFLTPPAASV